MRDVLALTLQIEAALVAVLFAASFTRKLTRCVKRKPSAREQLAKLGEILAGEARARAARDYVQRGFLAADEKSLRRGGARQTDAFRRCRALDLPLSEETWNRLFEAASFELRWSAMEYRIRQRWKFAIVDFLRFASRTDNRRRGALLHLLTCLAREDERLLLVLVEYGEGDALLELVLQALALYPATGMETAILARVTVYSPPGVLLAALDALTARPKPELMVYLSWLCDHSDWRVRERVARALAHFPSETSVRRLVRLSADSQYDVRRASARALGRLGPVAAAERAAIAADRAHPSSAFLAPELTPGRA